MVIRDFGGLHRAIEKALEPVSHVRFSKPLLIPVGGQTSAD
jgi:hypothetical protein